MMIHCSGVKMPLKRSGAKAPGKTLKPAARTAGYSGAWKRSGCCSICAFPRFSRRYSIEAGRTVCVTNRPLNARLRATCALSIASESFRP